MVNFPSAKPHPAPTGAGRAVGTAKNPINPLSEPSPMKVNEAQ
jgi:hypothetical protein